MKKTHIFFALLLLCSGVFPMMSRAEQAKIAMGDADLDLCKKDGVIKCGDGSIYINGNINSRMVPEFSRLVRDGSNVRINSQGGDAFAAMSLGKSLFDHKGTLLVDRDCIGVCAKYIIPAARETRFKPNSRVAIDYIYPNDLFGFAQSKLKGGSGGHVKLSLIEKDYLTFRKDVLDKERDYFDYLLVDIGYIYRYKEEVRSFAYSLPVRCTTLFPVFLILDKKYLDNFGIRVKFEGDNATFDKEAWIDLKQSTDASFIIGFDGNVLAKSDPPGYRCSRDIDPGGPIF